MTSDKIGLVSERIPNLWLLHQVIGLFPEMDFGEFAVIPAIGDDAML